MQKYSFLLKFYNKYFSDSWFGILVRGFSGIFPQIQCGILIMMTLLISSKFDHLAHATEHSLRNATPMKTNSHEITIVTPTTVEWMNAGDMTGVRKQVSL